MDKKIKWDLNTASVYMGRKYSENTEKTEVTQLWAVCLFLVYSTHPTDLSQYILGKFYFSA